MPQQPGFVWDGRVAKLQGLRVRVHDAYVARDGILHTSLLGLYVDGEVAWKPPEGAKPYWRGRITDIIFEFAR